MCWITFMPAVAVYLLTDSCACHGTCLPSVHKCLVLISAGLLLSLFAIPLILLNCAWEHSDDSNVSVLLYWTDWNSMWTQVRGSMTWGGIQAAAGHSNASVTVGEFRPEHENLPGYLPLEYNHDNSSAEPLFQDDQLGISSAWFVLHLKCRHV